MTLMNKKHTNPKLSRKDVMSRSFNLLFDEHLLPTKLNTDQHVSKQWLNVVSVSLKDKIRKMPEDDVNYPVTLNDKEVIAKVIKNYDVLSDNRTLGGYNLSINDRIHSINESINKIKFNKFLSIPLLIIGMYGLGHLFYYWGQGQLNTMLKLSIGVGAIIIPFSVNLYLRIKSTNLSSKLETLKLGIIDLEQLMVKQINHLLK